MKLTTKRLNIRPFEVRDVNDNYLRWLNDSEVTRFSNQRFRTHTVESSSAYLSSFVGTSNSFLLLELSSNRCPVGTATVYRSTEHGTADIGLMIGDRQCWGKGFGQEAWGKLLEALLAEPGTRKVTGGTARPNLAMVRIMERSRMTLEAVKYRHELIDGQPVDLLYYSRFV